MSILTPRMTEQRCHPITGQHQELQMVPQKRNRGTSSFNSKEFNEYKEAKMSPYIFKCQYDIKKLII